LQEAADSAARASTPAGLGLDSATVRQRMVAALRATGIADEAVLAAFAAVERHRFVDTALVTQAYEDTALPIGHGQTISKPSVVARMLGLLLEGRSGPRPLGRVLEIGGGCGYQAALLALLAREVVSIERLGELAARARERLAAMGIRDVTLLHADGSLGHPGRAPYDAIVCAAGAHEVPSAWLEQLAPAGRLLMPWHNQERGTQALLVVDRGARGFTRRVFEPVHFVPLKSGAA
jgi:protein-L-isoaspartate(D-aspartate) O-methyltransferase